MTNRVMTFHFAGVAQPDNGTRILVEDVHRITFQAIIRSGVSLFVNRRLHHFGVLRNRRVDPYAMDRAGIGGDRNHAQNVDPCVMEQGFHRPFAGSFSGLTPVVGHDYDRFRGRV